MQQKRDEKAMWTTASELKPIKKPALPRGGTQWDERSSGRAGCPQHKTALQVEALFIASVQHQTSQHLLRQACDVIFRITSGMSHHLPDSSPHNYYSHMPLPLLLLLLRLINTGKKRVI